MIIHTTDGKAVYMGDTFQIIMHRYSDPLRLNAARNAAIYLGKRDRGNTRRPLGIIKKGHVPEVFRGEYAEFEFVDVSKEVYDHLVTYTTRRMRVAGGNRALTSDDYTMPSDKMKDPDAVRGMIERSMDSYGALLKDGETPQVARAAMPTAAKLNPFVFSFNFVTLMESLLTQRIWQKGAQGNTVRVVRAMWELVHTIDPELWEMAYEYYGPPAIEWRLAGQMLKKMTAKELIKAIETDARTDMDAKAFDTLRMLFGEQESMWD